TNAKGEYSVSALDVPGAWLVSAVAPATWKAPEPREGERLQWAQTFYPGVTDPQLSTRVMVRLGGEASNVDIKLSANPAYRMRGVVLDTGGNPMPSAVVTLGKRFGPPLM